MHCIYLRKRDYTYSPNSATSREKYEATFCPDLLDDYRLDRCGQAFAVTCKPDWPSETKNYGESNDTVVARHANTVAVLVRDVDGWVRISTPIDASR
jgi:hypothetical protein